MRLNIQVEGKTYEVEVEVAESEPAGAVRYVSTGNSGASAAPRVEAAPQAANGSRPVADETKVCRSPVAGVASEVHVAVGDKVEKDQPLLILEAMKMFTTITSPVSGIVKAVEVEVAAPVKLGQLLVEFE